jgi:hypothetical protein
MDRQTDRQKDIVNTKRHIFADLLFKHTKKKRRNGVGI